MTQPNTVERAAPQRLTLLPGEVDVAVMDFSRRLLPVMESQAAETIASVAAVYVALQTTPPLLTGSTVISGSEVQIPVSGGLPGNTYQFQVLVNTSLGRQKLGLGWLTMPSIPI